MFGGLGNSIKVQPEQVSSSRGKIGHSANLEKYKQKRID